MSETEKCNKCELLYELYENTSKTERDYYVMTELFLLLHDGQDSCDGSKQPVISK